MTFLKHIAHQLIQNGWDKLQNLTLVFPMQRAGLFMKDYITNELRQSGYTRPVVLPRMLTIDELVCDLSLLRPADEIRSICLLYRQYCNLYHPTDLTLDTFFGWGRQLINDFSSVDMALLDADKVLSNTAAAMSLDEVQLEPETRERLQQLINMPDSDITRFYRTLWEQLPELYQQFTHALAEQHLGTKGACYRWVIEHMDQLQAQLSDRRFAFIGFNYLLPAERQLMTLLQGQSEFYFDNDPNFNLDDSVYQFVRKYTGIFGNAYCEEQVPTDEKKSVEVVACSSGNAQSQYVRSWLHQHHKAGQTTAIVIADETMLESVLYGLPEDIPSETNRIPFNITKGYPLRHTAMYAQVVKYLSDKQNGLQAGENSYADVLRRLSLYLTENTRLSPIESEHLSWQNALQNESYCQTQMLINRFISLFEDGTLSDVQQLKTLRNLLRRSMETISIPFHGEPIAPIQIIGVLETRLLDFDNVLVLNVEEGVLPGNASDQSYIPFDLRKAYDMPTHDEDTKVYAYNFFRLIRRAEQVTLLYSEASSGINKKSMSRFIMQMLVSDRFCITRSRLDESTTVSQPKSIEVNKTWINTSTALKDGKALLSLSPSALNTYIECPRQFYLKYIEHIQEPEEESLIMRPNELGSLIHGVMQYAYSQMWDGKMGSSVSKETILAYIADDVYDEHFGKALVVAYEGMNQEYKKYHPAFEDTKYLQADHLAENEMARTMVRNILRYDAEHLTNLRICALEQEYRHPIQVGDVQILVGGKIDRLDMIQEDGTDYLRILDYKTGSYKAEKMKAESINDLFQRLKKDHDKSYLLQTMIYSMVCMHEKRLNPNGLPIMPQLLYTQKLSGDPHVSMAGQPVTDYCALQSDFEDALANKLEEMLNDTTFYQCKEDICEGSFCKFHCLCGREKKSFNK